MAPINKKPVIAVKIAAVIRTKLSTIPVLLILRNPVSKQLIKKAIEKLKDALEKQIGMMHIKVVSLIDLLEDEDKNNIVKGNKTIMWLSTKSRSLVCHAVHIIKAITAATILSLIELISILIVLRNL